MAGHTALGPGGEFDAIRRMLARWGDRARGIGDDAALLDVPVGDRLVASTDSAVEGVHFRAAWLSPEEIGYRAVTAALSDLAAMAARPLGVLLALQGDWGDVIEGLADGIAEAAGAVGAPIIGGNLTAGPDRSITTTVLGSTRAPLVRGGAAPGDVVYVTGRLGGPGAALAAFVAGASPVKAHRRRFAHPEARIHEALWLAERGASAAIDISDGIVADARHLALASGVHVSIDVDALPVMEGISSLDAARSGEEYELLLTAPRSAALQDFASTFGVALTAVGEVTVEKTPGATLRRGDASVALPPGYDHFS